MPDDGERNAGGLAAQGGPNIRRLNTLRGLAALLVVLSHYTLWTRSSSGLFGIGQWGVMLFCVFMFLVPIGNPLLENGIGDKLGELSYSLYLLHAPLFAVMQPRSAWGLPRLFLCLACCLAVSQVSFSLVESPLRRLIRRLGTC